MAMMTQKAYAEKRGVTPQYINKLVSQKKIRLIGKKVDSVQADAIVKAHSRAGRVIPAARKAKASASKNQKTKSKSKTKAAVRRQTRIQRHSVGTVLEARLPGTAHGDATGTLTANRAAREYYEAERARLDYEERMGKLLPSAAVLEADRRKNENIRTMFRRMPRGVAPLLARCVNVAEVEDLLRREIDSILDVLSRDPLGMALHAAPLASSEALPVPPPVASPETVQESVL